MRLSCSFLIPMAIFVLFFSQPLLADEVAQQTAKVYRDYPGYVTPPTCDAPAHYAGGDREDAPPNAAEKPCRGCAPGKFYLFGWAGLGELSGSDLDFSQTLDFDTTYKHGFAGGAGLGYDMGSFRIDIEGSYRSNSLDTLEFGGLQVPEDGSVEIEALLLNVYYDWDIGSVTTPYIGIGGGVADVSIDNVKVAGVPLIDDSDSVWAAQASAGLLIALSRSLSIDLGYRFLITDDPDIETLGVNADTEIKHHAVMLGLQYRF